MTHAITCDQVVWLQNALIDFAQHSRMADSRPACSRYRITNVLACTLEIMEVLGLQFADEAARKNALSHLMLPGIGVAPVAEGE